MERAQGLRAWWLVPEALSSLYEEDEGPAQDACPLRSGRATFTPRGPAPDTASALVPTSPSDKGALQEDVLPRTWQPPLARCPLRCPGHKAKRRRKPHTCRGRRPLSPILCAPPGCSGAPSQASVIPERAGRSAAGVGNPRSASRSDPSGKAALSFIAS